MCVEADSRSKRLPKGRSKATFSDGDRQASVRTVVSRSHRTGLNRSMTSALDEEFGIHVEQRHWPNDISSKCLEKLARTKIIAGSAQKQNLIPRLLEPLCGDVFSDPRLHRACQ
jgi:hypothetical protein